MFELCRVVPQVEQRMGQLAAAAGLDLRHPYVSVHLRMGTVSLYYLYQYQIMVLLMYR